MRISKLRPLLVDLSVRLLRRMAARLGFVLIEAKSHLVHNEELRKLRTFWDGHRGQREELERLRNNARDDWVVVATGGGRGGTFTPVPIQFMNVPTWPRERAALVGPKFTPLDDWEPYWEFLDGMIPPDPERVSAIILTRDEAIRRGFEPVKETPTSRTLTFPGE